MGALAELATNPDNLLLFTSLVVTTVFVAQLSSFVLFGTSLSAPLQENAESGPVSGLLGIMMELFNIFPNLLVAFADIVGDIARPSDDEADDDDDEDTTNTNKFFIEPTNEDVANDEDEEDKVEDMEDGSGEAPGGLFDPLLNILASIFPPTRDVDADADKQGSGSGDGEEEEEEDNDIHVGVDVEAGSLLDMIINLIPGDEEGDEDMEDTTETDGGEGTTLSPEEEEGATFGGISVSLAPIDLANIFVQVQQIVGMNCTCAEGMTEEMITNTTMRLLKESLEEAKRMRLYSSLDTSSYSSLNDEEGGSKEDGARSRAPKRGKLSEKKKTKKGGKGRKKMWQPRNPKSLK